MLSNQDGVVDKLAVVVRLLLILLMKMITMMVLKKEVVAEVEHKTPYQVILVCWGWWFQGLLVVF